MGFDMKGLLNSQSTSGARRSTEMVRIPIDSIVPSAMNQYGIRDVELLAADIEENGLMHNLLVRSREDGTYEILSGERRYRACRMLYDGGNEAFAFIPCVIADATDDAQAEYMLLAANATARELIDAEKSMQAVRMLELLRKLRDEGHVFKGKMRDRVAELLDVSPAQVGRYQKIEAGLSDELKEEYRAGKINVTDAYDLARMTPGAQAEAAQEIREKGKVEKQTKEKSKSDLLQKDQIDAWIAEHVNAICNDYCKHPGRIEDELAERCKHCEIERLFRMLLAKIC